MFRYAYSLLSFLFCKENCFNNPKLLTALKLNFQQLLYTWYDQSSVFLIKKNTKPGTLKGKDALKQFPPIISAIFWHNLAHHEEIIQMLCTVEKRDSSCDTYNTVQS